MPFDRVLNFEDIIRGKFSVNTNTRHRQGDQHLVGVQPGIAAAQVHRFEGLDWFDGLHRQQMHLTINAGKIFQSIQ